MTTFAKELQKHLASYKSSRLGVKEAGIYLHKGKEVRHGHILPKDLKWLNILEPFRSEIREYLNAHREIRLHKYFHHLNSSQAFALNLFFPFFEGGASSALLRALGTKGSISNWLPEFVPDAEEGTNVDISWQDTNGSWTYCEVKLTEQEFSKAAGEDRHYLKLEKTYGPALRPYCPAELLQPNAFFAHYQILRNIWLAARDPKSSIVFLLPARNEALREPLLKVRGSLEPSLASRVHLAKLEHVLHSLSTDNSVPPRLSWYAQLLSEKYVVPESAT